MVAAMTTPLELAEAAGANDVRLVVLHEKVEK
jgi:hypothetical protein